MVDAQGSFVGEWSIRVFVDGCSMCVQCLLLFMDISSATIAAILGESSGECGYRQIILRKPSIVWVIKANNSSQWAYDVTDKRLDVRNNSQPGTICPALVDVGNDLLVAEPQKSLAVTRLA